MNSSAAWSSRKTPRCAANALSARSTPDAAAARRASTALARHCPNRTVLGILGRDGAFAEYLRLPDAQPDSDSRFDRRRVAVFVEPLAAAYEIFEQTHLARNQAIVVLGDGRLGALVALALKGEKYLPMVAGHHPEKLARLAELGLETDRRTSLRDKFDVVIDCTGSESRLSRAHSNWCGRAERSF